MKKSPLRVWMLIVLFGMQAGLAARAESLGRLFFTPKERTALEEARAGINKGPAATGVASTERPAQISGYVKRNDGRGIVWRDGVPSQQSSPDLSPQSVQTPSKVTVRRTDALPPSASGR